MLQIFQSYMDDIAESKENADELRQTTHYNFILCYARLIRFALQLRYTALATYRRLSEVFYFMKYATTLEKTICQFIIEVNPLMKLV